MLWFHETYPNIPTNTAYTVVWIISELGGMGKYKWVMAELVCNITILSTDVSMYTAIQ